MALLVKAGGGENVKPEVTEYETLLETAITNLTGKAFKPTQTKTVTPTASGLTVTPDEGQSLGEVIISGDADLIAENIRQGIDIFGVLGTMSEGLTPEIIHCSKMAIDKITFSSSIALADAGLEHSLGVVPRFFILSRSGTPTTAGHINHVIGGIYPAETAPGVDNTALYGYYSSGDFIRKSTSCTFSDSLIDVMAMSHKLSAGVEYTLITFA